MAAESVVKLKVESTEYEGKIKRATQGLLRIEEQCRSTGGILNKLEDENQNFVKSLGNMETVSKSAKGRIAELTAAFTDLRSMYNRMSNEEKKGEFGKELNKQLGIMKGRIQDAQAEMKSINSELGNGGNALDALTSTLGINIKQLAGWGMALGAGKLALDVLHDAFFNNENQLDEWGRIVESSQSVYNAFLNSLNNGDISGFLSNIDSIISAARDAYNSLDELGTYNAFNQRNKARNNAGYSEALEKYKKNPTAENKKALEEANRKVVTDLSTEAQKSEKAYQDALRKLAKERGLNKKEQDKFVQIFSNGSYSDLKSARNGYGRSGMFGMDETWNGKRVVNGKLATEDGRTVGGTTFREMTEVEKKQFKFAQALAGVNDTEIKSVQALGAQAEQLRQSVADQNRQFNRMSGNNGSLSGGHSSGSGRSGGGEQKFDTFKLQLQQFKAEIADPGFGGGIDGGALWKMLGGDISIKKLQDMKSILQQQFDAATSDQDRLKLKADIELTEGWIKAMQAPGEWTIDENGIRIPLKFDIDKKSLAASAQVFGKLYEETYGVKDNSEKTKAAWSAAASAIQSAGGAMQSMEDPAAKVAGIVMQAIANVALGFAQASASKATGAAGVLGWIAATTAGIATMVSTIAAIKSATEYHAQGGIVGMGSTPFIPRGTDTVPAMLTPGEVVLNQSQQRNLADNISSISQTRGRGIGMITTKLRGRDMIVMINNELKAQGRPTI